MGRSFAVLMTCCCFVQEAYGVEAALVFSVAVDAPQQYVQSFPMVAVLSVQGDSVIPQDLAETYKGGVGISFRFAQGDRNLSVGYDSFGRPEEDAPTGVPEDVRLHPLQSLTLTFDMRQLAFGTVPLEFVNVLPSHGEWEMKGVMRLMKPTESETRKVRVRPPSDLEKRIADQLAVEGTGKSWFPTVALSDDPVPDARKLPLETRQIVKLIGILRSAVKSPEAGIKAIVDAKEEWGYLDPLITSIRYECLLKLGKKDDAEKVRSRDPEFGRDLQFNLIDEGRGLIARLQALKAKQQAQERK